MLFNGSVRIYIKLRGKRLQFVLCKKIINNGYKIHCIRENDYAILYLKSTTPSFNG